ncbi:AAA domain-containing protein [Candidatus Uhrbacteria bacterium]|nr:AAA domain-containing protein [Candidatus Uhrbacteria bacterium]MBD3284269.1 AAA domain-containing protein [Candidatus Uhrbacteria bacterium]
MADPQTLEQQERNFDAQRDLRELQRTEGFKENVGLPSVDGLLVWGAPIDDFHLRFRKIRRYTNIGFHLTLIILSVLTVAAFLYRLFQQESIQALWTAEFWFAGYPEVTLFWLGLFLDAFIIFRLFEYSQDTKRIPGWGKSSVWLHHYQETAKERANFRFDISPYVDDSGWEVVASAFRLAKNLKRNEIGVPHLFAAALSSQTGARFLMRVGLSFDRMKAPIADLINKGASGDGIPPLSGEAKRVLISAYENARLEHRRHVTAIEIFLEAFKQDERIQEVFNQVGYPPEHVIHVAEWIKLRAKLREDHDRFVRLAMLKPKSAMNRSMTARATPLLDRFSEDLTLSARSGYLAPIVGRDREMGELLRAIESGQRSVIMVGHRGVGKQALIEGLARKMVAEDVPPELFDRRLVSINIPQVIAAGDACLAAERFFAILQEVKLSGNIILALQNIEALSGTGSGPLDLAEGLASELGRGPFIVIGTTTPENYSKYVERRSLGSRLIRVDVPELNPDAAIRVLMARCGAIEYKNKVFFTFASIERASVLSDRYLHDRALPAKALDVIREAAVLARKKRGENAFVTAEDAATIIHDKANVPVEAVSQDESQKLLQMEDHLHQRIIGQDAAVVAVAQAMRRARADLREGKRPIANFLFLGPTGVGKTETAKALAAEYFGSETNMIRVDMSEYQDATSVYRMIGQAGDERGGLLTEAVRKNPFSIVLLDEIEKAHPDILNLFLQVMDDGRLTDGVGRTIDFTNVVLIATSNAGTQFIQDETRKGTELERIKTMLLEQQLKGSFRPEFLNRFDAIIVFKPLSKDDVEQITWLMLGRIEKQLEEKGMGFRVEDAAVALLAEAGYDPLFGARPLRRVIQDRVDNQLADILLKGEAARRDTIVLDRDGVMKVEKAPPIG